MCLSVVSIFCVAQDCSFISVWTGGQTQSHTVHKLLVWFTRPPKVCIVSSSVSGEQSVLLCGGIFPTSISQYSGKERERDKRKKDLWCFMSPGGVDVSSCLMLKRNPPERDHIKRSWLCSFRRPLVSRYNRRRPQRDFCERDRARPWQIFQTGQ